MYLPPCFLPGVGPRRARTTGLPQPGLSHNMVAGALEHGKRAPSARLGGWSDHATADEGPLDRAVPLPGLSKEPERPAWPRPVSGEPSAVGQRNRRTLPQGEASQPERARVGRATLLPRDRGAGRDPRRWPGPAALVGTSPIAVSPATMRTALHPVAARMPECPGNVLVRMQKIQALTIRTGS
jgi:hypothetical protein